MTPHQAESTLSSTQLMLLTEQETALSPEQNISQLFIEQSQARNISCTDSTLPVLEQSILLKRVKNRKPNMTRKLKSFGATKSCKLY